VASVHLRFTASPEHVRTARLVATSVARRLGFSDEVLEEIRLGVGEACARAVQRSETLGHPDDVEVELRDDEGRLVVVVRDAAAGEGPGEAGVADAGDDLSLLLLQGLADSVSLSDGPGGPGGSLALQWDVASLRG